MHIAITICNTAEPQQEYRLGTVGKYYWEGDFKVFIFLNCCLPFIFLRFIC